MKKVLKGLMSAFLAVAFAMPLAACGQGSNVVDNTGKDPADWEGTLHIWTWTDDAEYQKAKFNEVYPKVEVIITKYGEGYEEKVQTTVMNGAPGPDIFGSDLKNVKKWTAGNYWENLSFGIYDAEEAAGALVDYVVDLGRDKNGDLRALSYQATPGGFWYNRAAAEQYLGTDDPDAISAMMTDFEGLLEMGETLYKNSGGKVALVPSVEDLFFLASNMREQPWVVDNRLIIDPFMYAGEDANAEDFMDIAKEVRDGGFDAKFEQWSADWYSAVETGKALGYFLPSWALNVLQGTSTTLSVNWGLAQGPSSFYDGGTYYGIYTKAQNKQLAWEFLKYIMFDEEYITQYVTDKNDMPSNRNVIEAMEETYQNSYAGNQNTMKYFAEEIEKIDVSLVTRYDDNINIAYRTMLNDYVLGVYSTKAEAIEAFRLDVKTVYQDLDIQ